MTPETITTGDGRTLQLSELEQVARAATPGPRRFVKRVQLRPGSRKYHCPREDGEEPICGTVNGTIVVKTEGGVFCASDESHIATFDRETCLALIAEVRRLASENATLRAERDHSEKVATLAQRNWLAAEAERDAALAEVARLGDLPEWIIRKLKTMEYYEPPTVDRDIRSEIQGWLHVLCFHYVQNRREVKAYSDNRKAMKQLEAEVARLRDLLNGKAQ